MSHWTGFFSPATCAGKTTVASKTGDTYADPWVLEGLLSCDPLGWVDGQHLVDQVFGLWSDRVPLWGRKLRTQTRPLVFTANRKWRVLRIHL